MEKVSMRSLQGTSTGRKWFCEIFAGLDPAQHHRKGDIEFDIMPLVRYVLDTCVVVSALRSRNGASHRMLRLAMTKKLSAVCHYKLLAEYREVLRRAVDRGEIEYSAYEVERILAAFVSVAEAIEVRYLWRPNLRDENDNFIFEIAFAASPATIVTHNLKDFRGAQARLPGVVVKTPRQIAKEFRGYV